MSRSDLVRGFSGVLLTSLCVGAGCSSSDGPSTPQGEAGESAANGGASAGADAQGGKAGKSGGRAGAGSGGRAGVGTGGNAAAGAGATAGSSIIAGAGPEGGSAGEPAVDPCAACAPGLCSPSGQCVECLPSNDQCPAGTYCSAANTCVDGCKNGDSCASGVCDANHDCQSCISDQECSEPHVCGAAQCASACTADQESGNAGCGTGLTCCSLHCVATLNDQKHCGACGTACTDSQFCGQSGCLPLQLSSLCQVGKIVIILDGQFGDDPTGRALGQALVDHCPTSQTQREVSQSIADALNPATGRPVSGSDEVLVVAGGGFFQHATDYLVSRKIAPVVDVNTQGKYEFHESDTDAVIASELTSEASESHDLFSVQFIREPSSGSLILSAYGFTVGGTAAAALYFGQVLAPTLSTASKAWYVGEWTDKDADQTPDLDEVALVASGT